MVEVFGADVDILQAARQAEAANEAVEHVGGVLAGMSHCRRDLRLTLGVLRLVPAHHVRQHDAGGIAVRHAELGAEYVTDAVARAHRHPRSQWSRRKPGADLAIHPCVEIVRIGFNPR